MKKSTFSESQIVKALKEIEGGRIVGEVARELGVAKATFYVMPDIIKLALPCLYNRSANQLSRLPLCISSLTHQRACFK